jgi:hypothetical protein
LGSSVPFFCNHLILLHSVELQRVVNSYITELNMRTDDIGRHIVKELKAVQEKLSVAPRTRLQLKY